MKNTTIILCSFGLFMGSTAMAQKTSSPGASAKAAISADQLRNQNTPVAPVPRIIKGSEVPGETQGAPAIGGNPVNRKVIVGKPENRPVSPQLKSDEGVIRIDFGIAQQGDNFTTFFPFNINTLENEETLATPVVKRSDYIRYVCLSGSESDITNVTLTNGTKFDRGANSAMSGNGFDLQYKADKPGAVDEMVMVYTNQGNIIYRLTGYVLLKETAVTVVDKK